MLKPRLELGASKRLILLLTATQLIPVFIFLLLPIALIWQLLGIMICMLAFSVNLRRHALKNGERAIYKVHALEANRWLLQDRQGHEYTGELLGSSFISRWLIILNFKVTGWRRSMPVLIAKDAVSSEDYRQLTAYLQLIKTNVQM